MGGREDSPQPGRDARPDLGFLQGLVGMSGVPYLALHDICAFIRSVHLTKCSNANLVFPGKAARAAAWPLLGAAARRVCGCHWKPIFPSEHCHHWDCQHHPARRQRAGAPELGHGLHPDRRHHQREPCPLQGRVGFWKAGLGLGTRAGARIDPNVQEPCSHAMAGRLLFQPVCLLLKKNS